MTIHMPVLPIVDGDLDVTVSATSFMGQDKVTKKLNVRVSTFPTNTGHQTNAGLMSVSLIYVGPILFLHGFNVLCLH